MSIKTCTASFLVTVRGVVTLAGSRNRFVSWRLLGVLGASTMMLSACTPTVEILPTLNTSEGTVKTLVARVKPGYCDYNLVTVDYREQGAAAWTSLGAPTGVSGDPGYHTYQISVPGSNASMVNQVFEQRWTVHVPAGSGWWDSYWCGEAVDVIRSATFLVTRAFDIVPSPSPLAVPAGQSRTLTVNVQRYGGFSGTVTVTAGSLPAGITVTPPSITVAGASGTMSITADLNLSPGELMVPFTATSATATGGSYTARVQVNSPFSLTASPNPLEVQRGGSSVLTVTVLRVSGFSGPVTLSLGGFPPGVTVPSPVTATGGTASISVTATMVAAPGPFQLVISGTAATVPHASLTTTVNVGRPAISSVLPGSQEKGMTITVNGQGFNPTCALNTVLIGTVIAIPTSCTATALTATLPDAVSFGNTTLSVTSAGLGSNSLPLRVRRKSGTFINVTSDVMGNVTNGRVCPDGLVRVDISGSYVATYRNTGTNAVIKSIDFDRDTPSFYPPGNNDYTESVGGYGGAGFASCTTGIVFDAHNSTYGCPGMVAFKMVDLTTGSFFSASPYCFNWYSGVKTTAGINEFAFVVPKVFHSPDGSIIALIVASPNGPELRIAFFDQANGGGLFRTVETTGGIGGTLTFTLTSTDQITFTKGSTSYGPFAVP